MLALPPQTLTAPNTHTHACTPPPPPPQVGLEPYTDIECGTACEALEDRGLLRLAEARGAAGRLVTLRVRAAAEGGGGGGGVLGGGLGPDGG
jgi:hypothetical protein